MRWRWLTAALIVLVAAAPGAAPRESSADGADGEASAQLAQRRNWPSFRGPRASGIAAGARPPLTWDVDTGTNVAWKTEIPGVGHSSPVVWQERVFVTTAVTSAAEAEFLHGRVDTSRSAADRSPQSWQVYCLDLATGEVLWRRTLHQGPPGTPRHVKGSYANPTPATNGRRLVVFFGSEGLYALDLDGDLLWARDLGVLDGGYTPMPDVHWGFASSPVLHDDLVIVQADAENQSFLAAFRAQDGQPVWRVAREQETSWSTPTVVGVGRDAQVVVSGTDYYAGYAVVDGTELWRLEDAAGVRIPTPLATADLILVGGGDSHVGPPFYALRREARGALSAGPDSPTQAIVWRNEARPHVVTPIAYRGLLYVCTDNGILTIYELATGARLNRLRVGGRASSFSASPVAAAGRLYFAGEDGEVFVLEATEDAPLLAENDIGEVVFATPAIADDTLLIRGRSHLFAFAEGPH